MRLKDGKKAPDFIIIGAMKSGTTSLHAILASRPDVYMPDKELYFFDVDDFEQHPDFFIKSRSGWTVHDYDNDFPAYYDWYTRSFEGASDHVLIGEDTTTYLASRSAPERINRLLPEVKLIVMLRDPVDRAYSHYWHSVAAGRISVSFEDHLRLAPGNTMRRGDYKEQLMRYRPFLEDNRLKVIIFEEFISNQSAIVADILSYLGLESVSEPTADISRNRATVPLCIPLRLCANGVYRLLARRLSLRNIPNMPGYDAGSGAGSRRPRLSKLFDLYRHHLPSRAYPAMKADTRAFLEKVYRKRNAGLSELIGRDVSCYWPYMD